MKLLNSKFAVKDCVKIMMVIAGYVLRKMNIKLTETMFEAEAWRVMIKASQNLFPAMMRKGFPEKIVHSIRLVEFKLDPQKMLEHYKYQVSTILLVEMAVLIEYEIHFVSSCGDRVFCWRRWHSTSTKSFF